MYATTAMPYYRPLAARPRGWWLALLFALFSLCAAMLPDGLGVQFAAPTWPGRSPVALKAARPLSARLAVLAQSGATITDRAATMRALSLPEDGPGSLLTD